MASHKLQDAIEMMKKLFLLFTLWWYHLESNQGHQDFQSCALPTELWYQNFQCFEFIRNSFEPLSLQKRCKGKPIFRRCKYYLQKN